MIGSCVTVFGSVPDVGGDGSQSETVLMTQRYRITHDPMIILVLGSRLEGTIQVPPWAFSGMADPTSDLGEDVTEDDAPRCENCDDPIVQDPDHRVVSEIEDGRVVHYHFCCEDCLAAWRE
jgi:hypothetical protein